MVGSPTIVETERDTFMEFNGEIYGHPKVARRHESWALMRRLKA